MAVQQSSTGSPAVYVMNGCPVLCSTEYGSTDSSPAGEHGLCADDAENIEDHEVSGNQEVVNTADAPVSAVSSSSPDLNCPICLGRLENRSYTDTCFHKFCFVCLVEWSKVKPVCPLCKQPFTSVIHNVQSYEDFEQLPITPGSTGAAAAAADSNQSRFRYPTTVIHGSSERRRQRESLQRPSRLRRRGSSRFDIPPPAFTSSFRRSLYRDGLWVRSVSDSGRYRDTSAEFFAHNPTAVHRLMPWLNRELMALLRNPADVTFLLEVILSTVMRVDITSETFHDLVAPFLGARTRHFIHEFNTFARSPFNMEAYDTKVVYERPPQIAPSSTPIEFSDTSSSDSSDAEIVEINSLVGTSESNLVVNDDQHAMYDGIFGLDQSMEDIGRNVSSPQPGPSHLQDIPLPRPLRLSHIPDDSVPSSLHSGFLSSVGQNTVRNLDNSNEGSDDDIKVVAEDKPWTDRSPVLLSSDTDADNEIELLHQTANNSETVDSQLSANTSQDVFPVAQDMAVNIDISERPETGLIHSDVQMSRDEITTHRSSQGSKTSSHQTRHHHKRAKKHKHRHHRDSSRHRKDLDNSESCSVSQHKKQEELCQMMQPRDEIVIDDDLSNEASTSANYTESEPDSNHLGSQMWISESSSDSDDYHSVRSVVVVPKQFKKNSSGHKRSRDST